MPSFGIEALILLNHEMKGCVKVSTAEVIAEKGAAKIDGGKLAVIIPEKLGYIWIKLK